MAKNKIRKEKLSIYVAKDSSLIDSVLLKLENAKEPIAIEIGNEKAVLYIKKDLPKSPPPWTQLFTAYENVPEDSFGASRNVGAVLIINTQNERFLLTFGSGFHLLNTEAIERDFGLRVTLNSVDPDKLRSIDKASYDNNPLNSRNQSAKEVDIFELQIDSELDMLYAVTGASNVKVFGTHVTGRDALTVMVETDLDGLIPVLAEAIKRYKSDLPEEFSWVDNINRVKDPELIEVLDLELNDLLEKRDFRNVWLGEPEVIDWESQVGYSFDMYQKTPRHVVLDITDLCEYLDEKGIKLTVDALDKQTIHVNNSEYQASKSWSAYRCLYVEHTVGDEQYILRNGIWYKADVSFVEKIDEYIKQIELYEDVFPIYNHDREEEYNSHVESTGMGFICMDKKNIKIGGKYDKVEFCDLMKNGNEFIHVKYYRSSSTLSHLFSQGYVSAEAFVKDEDFREKVNAKFPDEIKLVNVAERPNTSDYSVVYAIATKKELPDDLPFFSKVTLKNAFNTLRALGYKVKIARIEVDPVVLVKKKGKPEKEKKLH